MAMAVKRHASKPSGAFWFQEARRFKKKRLTCGRVVRNKLSLKPDFAKLFKDNLKKQAQACNL